MTQTITKTFRLFKDDATNINSFAKEQNITISSALDVMVKSFQKYKNLDN